MNTFFLMIQDGIKKIFSIFFLVLLARILNQNDFGYYQQIILVVNFFAMIFIAGMPTALNYFYAKLLDKSKGKQLFQKFFLLQIIIIFFGVFILLCLSYLISTGFKNTYIYDYSIFISLIFVGLVLPEFFRNSSVTLNKMKEYTIITSFIQIITILIISFVVIKTKNIIDIIIISSISSIVLVTILLLNNRKNFTPWLINYKNFKFNKNEISYVIAMSSTVFVGMINSYTDQIMTSLLLSPVEYSLLKVGAFQIPFISIITGSLLTAMIPLIAAYYKEGKLEKIQQIWSDSIEKATVLLVPIIIFCLVFGKEIIINFFGIKYQDSVIIFQIYMLQWLRAVVIFGGVMGAIGLEKALFKNTITMMLVNIIVNYFMIIKFGIIGAAITTTLLNYIGCYPLIIKINKVLPNKFSSYFPFKSYFFIFAVSIIICLILKLCLSYLYIWELIYISILYYGFVILLWLKYKKQNITINNIKGLL